LRIGLASDSFGNLDALGRALDLFAREAVDRVYFLGGRLADVDAAIARRRGAREGAPVPRTDSEFLAAFEDALARHAAEDPIADRIVRVASRACPEAATGAVPTKQVDLVEGRICCLVHDKSELDRDDITNATVLFHGNSDRAALVQIGPRYFVTPGRLRAAPKGADGAPTFGLLEMTDRDLVLTVYSADRVAELRRDRASFAAGAKMSVR
jgi:predicted phosphodiesterase